MAAAAFASNSSMATAFDPVHMLARLAVRHVAFLSTPHTLTNASASGGLQLDSGSYSAAETFLLPWLVQFVASWVAFLGYMANDYRHYRAATLESAKLPTRHPLKPFWPSQLRMLPLVLYNQCVVWPLTSLLLVWPQWSMARGSYGWLTLPVMLLLMLVSDQMWYAVHRAMHTPFAWRHWHKMHHVAEQCALSATYVHAVEYACWCFCMQMPFALAGFNLYTYCVALAWGCGTGAGAHSGYSEFADGDKHNAHHLYHNVNFGLLMIADWLWGTHWAPGDPAPRVWSEAVSIWAAYPDVHGSEGAMKEVKRMEKPWENLKKVD